MTEHSKNRIDKSAHMSTQINNQLKLKLSEAEASNRLLKAELATWKSRCSENVYRTFRNGSIG